MMNLVLTKRLSIRWRSFLGSAARRAHAVRGKKMGGGGCGNLQIGGQWKGDISRTEMNGDI